MGDDSGQIVTNTFIRSLNNIPSFFLSGTFFTGGLENRLLSDYYRPIMIIWYALIYSIRGLSPFFYHFFQIVLHVINAFIVFLILQKFLSNKKLSFFLSLMFLLHPIQSEAISHLANVQDILFFFFGALGLYSFIRKNSSLTSLVTMFFLYLLALFSKEVAIVFYVMMIVYMELFRTNKHLYKLYWLGCLITIGVYVYVRCFLAHICTLGGGLSSVIPIARMTPWERVQQMPAMVFFYIKTFFYPDQLSTYQYWIAQKNISGLYLPLAASIIFFTLIMAVPFFIYIYQKKLPVYLIKQWFKNNSYTAKVYAFFLVWLLTGLALHSNILPLDATVAERWFYFPIVGLIGIIGVLITLFPKKTIIYMILIFYITIFAVRSHMRAREWSSAFILFSHDIMISHNSATLENNYGALLYDKGDMAQAELHFRKAIKLAPKSPIYWNNLGEVYEKKGNDIQAEKYYRKSIQEGRFFVAWQNYTNLLIRQKRIAEAKNFLKHKAIKTFPYNEFFQKKYHELNKKH